MAEASMPVRDVIAMIGESWDLEDIEDAAAAQLFRQLCVRLLDRLQGHSEAAGITLKGVVEEFRTPGDQKTPYEQGEEVWTVGHGREPRQWFVDQRGGWVEADSDPPPVVQQAWHGDDPAPGPLTPMQRTDNQHAATKALASGRITVEEVGAVVKGLHPASMHFAFPEVLGE